MSMLPYKMDKINLKDQCTYVLQDDMTNTKHNVKAQCLKF